MCLRPVNLTESYLIMMDYFILTLTLQESAAIISLGGALLVVAVVIFLLASAKRNEDKTSAKHKVYKVRARYFWGLTIVLVILLLVTLRFLPYPQDQGKPAEVVTVVGAQWVWQMAPGALNQSPKSFTGQNQITLPVNKKIEFIVTSVDVNHGFGIYNSEGVLLAQTQAMPGYDNKLEYRFTQKGVYKVLCMEYCGIGHPIMDATIQVQ